MRTVGRCLLVRQTGGGLSAASLLLGAAFVESAPRSVAHPRDDLRVGLDLH
jgi:hypothetical protein